MGILTALWACPALQSVIFIGGWKMPLSVQRKINQAAIDMTLSTDASKLGWEASALDQVTGDVGPLLSQRNTLTFWNLRLY